jgi:hypothetical protein
VFAPADILATVAEDKRHEFGIVRLPVSFLQSLKLTVEIRIDSRVPGHVVLPELNAVAYAADKAAFTLTLLRLAEVASKDANIVLRPSPGSDSV